MELVDNTGPRDVIAATGATGLGIIKFDVVVIRTVLPATDGIELARAGMLEAPCRLMDGNVKKDGGSDVVAD